MKNRILAKTKFRGQFQVQILVLTSNQRLAGQLLQELTPGNDFMLLKGLTHGKVMKQIWMKLCKKKNNLPKN
jgi:hypothetical protein